MLSQVKISYENMGSSSYLAAAFLPEAGVVNYQLEMLAANEIRHFLPVSKRLVDGEVRAYYNISSKIALSQILGRRKLGKTELIQLLKGFLAAAEEGEQYQLPANGLVMEPEYIFMDPSSMEPSFVYLPVSVPQEKGVKELVFSLVMEGKIELTGDNFIQLLLEAVNKQPFRLEDLKKLLNQVQTGAGKFQNQAVKRSMGGSQPVQPVQPAQSVQSVPPVSAPAPSVPSPSAQMTDRPMQQAQAFAPSQGAGPAQPQKTPGKMPAFERPGKPSFKKDKKEKTKPVKNEPVTTEDDGFDPEKAKKKFLLPQAVIMVAVSAMVSFGAFTDKAGNIAVKNILAVVLILVVTEVILYREAYVNSRKKGAKTKSAKTARSTGSAKPEKAGKKPAGFKPSVPGGAAAGSRPVPPSGFGAAGAKASAPVPPVNQLQRPEPAVSRPVPSFNPVPPVQPQPQAPVQNFQTPPVPVTPSYAAMPSMPGGSDETELWDGTQGGMSVYLEYYENGQMTRIPLDKPSVLVGRLKGQVDFAVANPKVGKIHAEFINQDGLIYVKDLNSKNGTYINGNGQRIGNNVPYPLSNNDRVTLADSEFTLRCGS